MLSFNDPLTMILVLALSAWGGMYVFRLVRLGIGSRQEPDDLGERTERLLSEYRRKHNQKKVED